MFLHEAVLAKSNIKRSHHDGWIVAINGCFFIESDDKCKEYGMRPYVMSETDVLAEDWMIQESISF
jgi:hypothetical protein